MKDYCKTYACLNRPMDARGYCAKHEPVSMEELNLLRHQNMQFLKVYDAAKNLLSVKGRHHSEQAYKRLEEAVKGCQQ